MPDAPLINIDAVPSEQAVALAAQMRGLLRFQDLDAVSGGGILSIDASGNLGIGDPVDGATVPYTGYLPGTAVTAEAIAVDRNGRPIHAIDQDGRRYVPDIAGLWSLETETLAPYVGYLPGSAIAPDVMVINRSGRPLSALDSAGRRIVPDIAGLWAGEDETQSPSIGYLDTRRDSAATALVVAANGALIRADVDQPDAYAIDYLAGVNGPVRRETRIEGYVATTTTSANVSIPAARIEHLGSVIETPPVTLVSPGPASAAVVDEVVTVRYNDIWWLGYQYVRGAIVVTRVSDNAVLVAGVDYTIDPERGVITGLVNTAAFSAKVSYTGAKQRTDIVCVNAQTRQMTLVSGTESPSAASMFVPALPSTHLPLFRLFRWVDGVEIMPVYLARAPLSARVTAQVAAAKSRLFRFRRKMFTAASLKVGLYGDSTGSLGGGTTAEMNLVPNGPRDRIGYYQALDAAALAAISKSDLGDGLGNTHVETSWGWLVVRYLRSLGLTVSYENWCIPGTDSSNTVNGNGYYNQGHPSRLAASAATGIDLMIYVPGMNDYGSESAIHDRICTMVQTWLTAGIDVILSTPARENPRFRDRYSSWLAICSEILRAAETMGVASADSQRVFANDRLAATGISIKELAQASRQNHAGTVEQSALASLLIELLQ